MSAAESPSRRARTRALLRPLALPLLLLLGWEAMSRMGATWAYAFVPLSAIGDSFVELWHSGELAENVLASMWTAWRGLLYGCAAGIVLGAGMALWRPLDLLLNPLVQAMRQLPNLAIIPLVALWFGNTEFSKLLVVSLAVFEAMVLNTYEGLQRVDRRLLDVARALTLGRWATFRRVLLPAALPSISTGMQHGVAFAWLSTIGVELLFTVGPGLSTIMDRGQQAARMDVVIACLVIISLLGLTMHHLVRRLLAHLLRWQHVAYR